MDEPPRSHKAVSACPRGAEKLSWGTLSPWIVWEQSAWRRPKADKASLREFLPKHSPSSVFCNTVLMHQGGDVTLTGGCWGIIRGYCSAELLWRWNSQLQLEDKLGWTWPVRRNYALARLQVAISRAGGTVLGIKFTAKMSYGQHFNWLGKVTQKYKLTAGAHFSGISPRDCLCNGYLLNIPALLYIFFL